MPEPAPTTARGDVDAAGSATGPAAADVLLADGTIAVIRPLAPADEPAVTALHERTSADNLRLRFFTPNRRVARAYVAHLVHDHATLALIVVRNGELVGLGTAEQVAAGTAEVSFLVDDTLHGLGLGSLLLEHLAAAGRGLGLRRFVAEVLGDNHPMVSVFRDAGFEVTRRAEDGCVHVVMDTAASAAAVDAADERECRAEARSLRPLLYPRGVALTGVRRDGTGVGAAVLRSIVAGGYTGTVHVVHPSGAEIGGIPTLPRLADVPGPVDLVVVAVPAPRVLDTLRDAADAGIPAAVVLSSGFEELGEAGAALQRELLVLARTRGIRVVGPNCLGLMSNHPEVALDATFSGAVPPPGGLAVASQSGGVGIVIGDTARRLGLGVGSFVSLGNKADVSGNDLLAAWRDDPRVTGAALYLESFGNAPKFARFARRFAERKPLLAVVGGRSAGGRRAGVSHTAAAASSSVGVAALFAQAGVIGCSGAEDMAETALLLAQQPLPRGNRVAVLSNAGGMGVLAADAADDQGLVVPELSDELRAAVATHVRGTAGTGNPVDAGAGAGCEDVVAVAELLLASGEVDALVVVLVATGLGDVSPMLPRLAEARAAHPDLPVVLVPLGGLVAPAILPGVTTYGGTAAAMRALGRAARYAAWRTHPRGTVEAGPPERAERARGVAERLLDAAGGVEGWLDAHELAELLGGYDLVPVGRVVNDPVAAAAAAAELGFPVAVKVADRDVVHKTDRGLVRVGLGSASEVLAAVRGFETDVGRAGVTVLVQPMGSGAELAVGVVRDPGFGPLVMVAAGGTETELWADRVFLLPPVTPQDAARAVRSLRVWPLLDGFRSRPRADTGALEDLVVRIGRLAEEVPQVADVDLNPVLVGPDGCVLVDVKVRLAGAALLDAGIPRRLRGSS